MSKVLDVALDTCVFFKMIEYNNFVEAYGEKFLQQFIELKENELKTIREDLESHLGKEFFEKYNKISFDEQLEKYKAYATGLESTCIDGMRRASDRAELATTAEERDRQASIYNKYLNMYETLCKNTPINENLQRINDYKILKNDIYAGKVYRDALDGEYKLYISFIAFDEVLYHTRAMDNSNFLHFDYSEINALINRLVTVVTTKSKTVLNLTDYLANEYRTGKNTDTERPMDVDLNAADEYGDSKIAAFANLTGMILITFNGKDFIFDKGSKFGNDKIRTHLKNVNSKYDFTTDASVYSPRELVEGKVIEPKKKSKVLKFLNGIDNTNDKVSNLLNDDELQLA